MSNRGITRARRHHDHEAGFTLIELLVVVIVIGILAAIAIPVYLGVQQNSREAGVVSDVANLKTAVLSLKITNDAMPGALPATTSSYATTWTDAGATWGSFTTHVVYKPGTGATFCVAGLSSTGTIFFGTDSKGVARSSLTTLDAVCP